MNTGMNPNKLFYTCKDRTCDFWDWAHPLNLNSCENGTKVLEVHMKLEQLNSNMEKEHKKFSKVLKDTGDDVKDIKNLLSVTAITPKSFHIKGTH
ncbi:unnamed protein product [Trifolium pratense]|uniref:Uncharacterized protein n=2 Tax=Trifolium pratense TaxID=57577 RepID=A0ACB0JNV6_TRIPR|nr:unnamed protein product [Trifolium pratense]CAJ2646785.1 unnamed protein product [Trifolium pratense]